MDRSSSTVRRRAWINSSRQWPTVEDPKGPLSNIAASASIADDDDVFSDAGFTGKIENWLLRCGSDVCLENCGQLSFESALQANTLSDDLSLGADALVVNFGETTNNRGHPSLIKQQSRISSSTPRQKLCPPSLNLGHSMASSCLSSSTWKTVSSVSEVLQMCSEDAEETLYELGFGCEEPQVTVRIPPRFFTFPSQAQGINFRLFLDAQIRRIREEDPSLSLASRFRQVQVLTAMANAFYSLYSHVSRTPLQKLATPEFSFSSPVERIERFRTSIRSEPRSPVERLKDTVNKMCLYTGSPRGSDSTSPQPSPRKRSSLPEVVDIMLKSKAGSAKKLELGEHDRCGSCGDFTLLTDGGDMEQTQQAAEDTDIYQEGNKIGHEETVDNEQADNTDYVRQADGVRTSLTSSISGETVIETETLVASDQPELDSCLTPNNTRTSELSPGAKVTFDLICPQIVESVHQAPFCCQNKNHFLLISGTESRDRLCSPSHKPTLQTLTSEPNEDSHPASSRKALQVDGSGSPPVLKSSGSYGHCCITVTGWEEEDVSLSSMNSADSCHAPPASSTRTPVEPFNEEEGQYLNPLTHPGPGKFSSNRQQVNSFELEEVHSAGEDDFGQPEAMRTVTSSLCKKHSYKGEVVRGDSMQSDSSGYADEEVSPSPDRHSRSL
ncbi:protein ITPRID2 [Girardinichthys multiradiatus]|uniref:protein ITPRID2 n=1 Tax=Girardinichthys multiradiatus TaxID=208333 RepID=UPI001FAE5DD0|nr:protein ITPRID2 [Girardinichthys multiradiatus]XP_047204846.1 protein ITPRID2 [Girardinichthys multiradiatus]